MKPNNKQNDESEDEFYFRIADKYHLSSHWVMPNIENFDNVACAAGPTTMQYGQGNIHLPQRALTWLDIWIAGEAAMYADALWNGEDVELVNIAGFQRNGDVLVLTVVEHGDPIPDALQN